MRDRHYQNAQRAFTTRIKLARFSGRAFYKNIAMHKSIIEERDGSFQIPLINFS